MVGASEAAAVSKVNGFVDAAAEEPALDDVDE